MKAKLTNDWAACVLMSAVWICGCVDSASLERREFDPATTDADTDVDTDSETVPYVPGCSNGVWDAGETCLDQTIELHADGIFHELVVARLDNNERDDLAGLLGSDLLVYLAKDDNTFQSKQPQNFGSLSGDDCQLLFGDLDGEGTADLVLADIPAKTMYVGGGVGDGRFTQVQSEVLNDMMGMGWTALGDFHSAETALDIVTNGMVPRFGVSDGQPVIYGDPWYDWFEWDTEGAALVGYHEIVPGDFDGDGFDDFACIITDWFKTIQINSIEGQGATQRAQWVDVPNDVPVDRFRSADVTGDEIDDVVSLLQSKLFIVPGSTTLDAAAFEVDLGGNTGADFDLGDINGDGHLDAVVCDLENAGQIQIHWGDGVGGFTAGPIYADSCQRVVAGDFNGDGLGDVATARVAGGLFVRFNTP